MLEAERFGKYYDREGNEIDWLEWGENFENLDYRIIHKEEVGDYIISTVWLGLDHRFFNKGLPLIFETVVLDKDEQSVDMFRYSTEGDARKGHAEFVESYRKEQEEKEQC